MTISALYITIKKAFTPFAAIHMLKQLMLSVNSEFEIDEIQPLEHYVLTTKDEKFSQFIIKGDSSSKGLQRLSCSCNFYHNMAMICQHLCYLLTKLQFKSMSCVEHLKFWREYVGYKSKNMNDKRDTSTYKVRKEKRLKSFMEKITKKRKLKI